MPQTITTSDFESTICSITESLTRDLTNEQRVEPAAYFLAEFGTSVKKIDLPKDLEDFFAVTLPMLITNEKAVAFAIVGSRILCEVADAVVTGKDLSSDMLDLHRHIEVVEAQVLSHQLVAVTRWTLDRSQPYLELRDPEQHVREVDSMWDEAHGALTHNVAILN